MDTLYYVYYAEINIVCIAVLFLLLGLLKALNAHNVAGFGYFRLLMVSTIIYSSADIVASMARGQKFEGARAIIYASNMTYLFTGTLIGYFWLKFTLRRLYPETRKNRKLDIWLLAPLVFLLLVIITAPINPYVFVVDENNYYQRGSFLYLQWGISWLYLVAPSCIALTYALTEKKKTNKLMALRMSTFFISPLIGAIIQGYHYGITTNQVGYMISILIIMLGLSHEQVYRDGLTGLNNKGSFMRYLEKCMEEDEYTHISVITLDISRFKDINKEYGRFEGDKVLIKVAEALKGVSAKFYDRIFIARYGGDEFALVLMEVNNGEKTIKNIIDMITNDCLEIITEEGKAIDIKLNFGFTNGLVRSYKSPEDLLLQAQLQLREEKQKMNW